MGQEALDRHPRMELVAQYIPRYDFVMIQEVWSKKDADRIRRNLPKGYFMTEFNELADSCEDYGVFFWPQIHCSGKNLVYLLFQNSF